MARLDAVFSVHGARDEIDGSIDSRMDDFEFGCGKIPLEETVMPCVVRPQHADATNRRELAPYMVSQCLDHVHDLQRRVRLQFVHERVAQEAGQHDRIDAALLERTNEIEYVQLAFDRRRAGSAGAAKRMLLEYDVEVIGVAGRGRRLDELEKYVGAGERAEPTNDAKRAAPLHVVTHHFASLGN